MNSKTSEAQKQALARHRLKYKEISFEVTKDKYLEIENYYRECGFKNRKEFILTAIDYYMSHNME